MEGGGQSGFLRLDCCLCLGHGEAVSFDVGGVVNRLHSGLGSQLRGGVCSTRVRAASIWYPANDKNLFK